MTPARLASLCALALVPACAAGAGPASAAPRPSTPAATIVEIGPPEVACPYIDTRAFDVAPDGGVSGTVGGCGDDRSFTYRSGVSAYVPGRHGWGIDGSGRTASTGLMGSTTSIALRGDELLATDAAAFAIDEAGTVAGHIGLYGSRQPVLWPVGSAPVALPLGDGHADGYARGISETSGIAVGRSGASAARWLPGAAAPQLLAPLWGPTELESAYAVNDAGDAVGTSRTSDGYNHAVLWRAGSSTPVRVIPKGKVYMSSAYGIDDTGRIVGTANGPRAAAFVWSPRRGYVELISLVTGWDQLVAAYGINDAGQIAGFGMTKSGWRRAFLLTLPAGF